MVLLMPTELHILALDTSGRIADLALLSVINGRQSVRCLSFEGTTQHAERLLPQVGQLLDEAGVRRDQLSVVAFGQGPGAFTGLRVACGVAQGLAFALGIGVVAVGSLFAAALADDSDAPVQVLVQDARMNEVYLAVYRCSKQPGAIGGQSLAVAAGAGQTTFWTEIHPPVLMAADAVTPWLRAHADQWLAASSGPKPGIVLMGDALSAYPQQFESLFAGAPGPDEPVFVQGKAVRPQASAIAKIALARVLAGQVSQPHEVAPLYVRNKVAFTTSEREHGMGGNPAAALPLVVSPMTVDDIGAVFGIESVVQAFPWTHGNFLDAVKSGYLARVARLGETVVGFYIAQFIDDLAHLLLIAVAPAMQRRGAGHQLLQHFEAEACRQQARALTLEVRVSNQAAVNFYKNRGFVQTGVRKQYYRTPDGSREDALILDKPLREAAATP